MFKATFLGKLLPGKLTQFLVFRKNFSLYQNAVDFDI